MAACCCPGNNTTFASGSAAAMPFASPLPPRPRRTIAYTVNCFSSSEITNRQVVVWSAVAPCKSNNGGPFPLRQNAIWLPSPDAEVCFTFGTLRTVENQFTYVFPICAAKPAGLPHNLIIKDTNPSVHQPDLPALWDKWFRPVK